MQSIITTSRRCASASFGQRRVGGESTDAARFPDFVVALASRRTQTCTTIEACLPARFLFVGHLRATAHCLPPVRGSNCVTESHARGGEIFFGAPFQGSCQRGLNSPLVPSWAAKTTCLKSGHLHLEYIEGLIKPFVPEPIANIGADKARVYPLWTPSRLVDSPIET